MNPLKVDLFLASCEGYKVWTDRYRNFLKYFPSGFSTELKKDIDKVFARYDLNFFVCRNKNDKQKAYCINCKRRMVLPDECKHNDKYVCPHCGIKGTIKHSWRTNANYPVKNTMYMHYYEKADYDKKSIICRGLVIKRWICLETLQVKYNIKVDAYYLFQHDNCKMVRYYGETCYNSPCLNERKSIYPLWNNYRFVEVLEDNIESLKRAIKGTKWEHCCYEELLPYLDDDFIRLFEFYDKYPQMEYIVKAGFASIIAKKIKKQSISIGGSLLNLKAVDIRKSLKLPGLTKKDKKFIKSFNGDVTPEQLKLWQILKSENQNTDLNFECLNQSFNNEVLRSRMIISEIVSIHKLVPSLKKIAAYVYKQLEIYGKRIWLREYDILHDWKDYLNECKFLDLNLNDTAVLFPKNLRVAHENTSKQFKIKNDELANEKIKRLALERQRYKYLFKGLVSMPAASIDDLIAEGAALHHCVGTYADKYVKGKTDIVFIRKFSEIDKPFYTMEVIDNKIAQVRGSHNCGMTDEVKEFVEHFKNDVLNKPKKISNKKGSNAA